MYCLEDLFLSVSSIIQRDYSMIIARKIIYVKIVNKNIINAIKIE